MGVRLVSDPCQRGVRGVSSLAHRDPHSYLFQDRSELIWGVIPATLGDAFAPAITGGSGGTHGEWVMTVVDLGRFQDWGLSIIIDNLCQDLFLSLDRPSRQTQLPRGPRRTYPVGGGSQISTFCLDLVGSIHGGELTFEERGRVGRG